MPTSARAILHHTDEFYVLFCTRLYVLQLSVPSNITALQISGTYESWIWISVSSQASVYLVRAKIQLQLFSHWISNLSLIHRGTIYWEVISLLYQTGVYSKFQKVDPSALATKHNDP